MHPYLALRVAEILMKRKGLLLDWEANGEGLNVKDNELLSSCPFGVHFKLWLFVQVRTKLKQLYLGEY